MNPQGTALHMSRTEGWSGNPRGRSPKRPQCSTMRFQSPTAPGSKSLCPNDGKHWAGCVNRVGQNAVNQQFSHKPNRIAPPSDRELIAAVQPAEVRAGRRKALPRASLAWRAPPCLRRRGRSGAASECRRSPSEGHGVDPHLSGTIRTTWMAPHRLGRSPGCSRYSGGVQCGGPRWFNAG